MADYSGDSFSAPSTQIPQGGQTKAGGKGGKKGTKWRKKMRKVLKENADLKADLRVERHKRRADKKLSQERLAHERDKGKLEAYEKIIDCLKGRYAPSLAEPVIELDEGDYTVEDEK